MTSRQETYTKPKSAPKKSKLTKFLCRKPPTCGFNNWLLIFTFIHSCQLIIDNYLRYRIVKNIPQITAIFIEFMYQNRFYYFALISYYVIQLIGCFFIEKALQKRLLSETLGLYLHLFNALSLFNINSYLLYIFKLAPRITSSIYIFHITVKIWSYVFVNKQQRILHERKIKFNENNNNSSAYCPNFSFINLMKYFICCGSCIYDKSPIKINFMRSLGIVVWDLLKIIAIHYSVAFLFYQYIIPESENIKIRYNSSEYLAMVNSILKIIIPLNIIWILYFHLYCLKTYLPLYGKIWGSETITVVFDWWNASDSSMFWSRWNYQMHRWFKDCFFQPALQNGYSKLQASLIVALVSGILHEYLLSVPCGTAYGVPTIVMVMQIPLSKLTTKLSNMFGQKIGNIIVWICLIASQTISYVYVYYNLNK